MAEEAVWKTILPVGEYQDCLVGPDGEVIWTTPWQRNLIVENLRRLLAALLKGDTLGKPLTHWAVGRGEEDWDSDPNKIPPESERYRWETLKNEVGRKPLTEAQVVFLGGTFTNQLQISMEFTADDITPGENNQNRRLREFGLFAGGSEGSGACVLINHRVHPRIDLEEGFTLQRTLRLTF